ncbi:MAG TPA: GntR family transcriptional regulator [Clostridia bacterium]|nr:GntR family transcriptional regulator [Clostridia bacterium]
MSLGYIDPKDFRPIRDIVYEIIRNAILDGRLEKGKRIMETTIADDLSISRTPVREAFRMLENEGLIEYFPKTGIIVKGITLEDIVYIYDVREVLEGLAVHKACMFITKEEINKLKEILRLMEQAIDNKDNESLFMLHSKYNKIIIDASQNPKLIEYLTNIYEYINSFRKITLSYNERKIISLKEHIQIVEYLEAGDAVNGEKYCREHIRVAKQILLESAGRKLIIK